LHKNVTAEVTL